MQPRAFMNKWKCDGNVMKVEKTHKIVKGKKKVGAE